ncbi:hypothetical protein V8G54_010256 [Vigna mungo]|uniref:Uncharacterized protein n=1 Tax=Vigna mungo TaxID=3915 RepID=A0AAQ3S2W1_VIGMU
MAYWNHSWWHGAPCVHTSHCSSSAGPQGSYIHLSSTRRNHFDLLSDATNHQEDVNAPSSPSSPFIHCSGKWRYNKAWEQFLEQNQKEPFDVVHSETSVFPNCKNDFDLKS